MHQKPVCKPNAVIPREVTPTESSRTVEDHDSGAEKSTPTRIPNHRCDSDSIGQMNIGILARKPGKEEEFSSKKTVARTHSFPEFSSMHHQGEITAFWAAIRQPGFCHLRFALRFSPRIQFTPWSTVCTPRQRALIRLDRSFR